MHGEERGATSRRLIRDQPCTVDPTPARARRACAPDGHQTGCGGQTFPTVARPLHPHPTASVGQTFTRGGSLAAYPATLTRLHHPQWSRLRMGSICRRGHHLPCRTLPGPLYGGSRRPA
jgi:hypothetical protein